MTYSIFSFQTSASWMLNAAIWSRNITQMHKHSVQQEKKKNSSSTITSALKSSKQLPKKAYTYSGVQSSYQRKDMRGQEFKADTKRSIYVCVWLCECIKIYYRTATYTTTSRQMNRYSQKKIEAI